MHDTVREAERHIPADISESKKILHVYFVCIILGLYILRDADGCINGIGMY
jgi:hypothetical protein